ncbi:mycothiol transferase [Sinomonas albida]|uniref:mycothiol transferase n=1 Tax=Sinomonas albida TaxID=369942 RepID=UPI0010A77543|nr:DUF664 domain-containing protein [Sinomonas albida]
MEPQQNWAITILEDGFGRVREGVEHALLGLTPEQLTRRPSPASNSVGWLVWHLARVTDDHFAAVAHVLGGGEAPRRREREVPPGQVWPEWQPRLGTPYPEGSTGYGHTSDQVAAFPQIDPALLNGYHAAVHDRALGILGGLGPDDFGTVVDLRWDPPVVVAVRIMSILNDATQHVGQAAYVRGLLTATR